MIQSKSSNQAKKEEDKKEEVDAMKWFRVYRTNTFKGC